MSNDFSFARGLRKLMEREDIPQCMLADFSGVREKTISETLREITVPRQKTKDRLAEVFRMTAEAVEAYGKE